MASRKKASASAKPKTDSMLLEMTEELYEQAMNSKPLLEGTLKGARELDLGLGVRWEDVLRELKSR